MTTITKLSVRDIRFPTSRSLDGSDAMNAAPDYSATYVTLETDSPQEFTGHGLTFTIGRGNEICVTAVNALEPLIVGKKLEDIAANMGAFWLANEFESDNGADSRTSAAESAHRGHRSAFIQVGR